MILAALIGCLRRRLDGVYIRRVTYIFGPQELGNGSFT